MRVNAGPTHLSSSGNNWVQIIIITPLALVPVSKGTEVVLIPSHLVRLFVPSGASLKDQWTTKPSPLLKYALQALDSYYNDTLTLLV